MAELHHSTCLVLAGLLVTAIVGARPMLAMGGQWFVSPGGADDNPGTREKPFATLALARDAARKAPAGETRTVWLLGGTYYLGEMLVLDAGADGGTKEAPLVFQAVAGQTPVISGGLKLQLTWRPYKGGILQATVPGGLATDQLFVNGQRQHMARYPNYDANQRIFNGYAADAISHERASRWADPNGGYIHAMHSHMWGDFHYRITGKDAKGDVTYEGGWQNNRRMGMHKTYRFVENIFEELDAPGEWYCDAKTNTLYFWPPAGVDMPKALVEAVRLRCLVELRGSADKPIRNVTFRGITFRHAARTFMDNKEPLLRSDWTIYRGGAFFLDGAADCSIEDCAFDQVGGNAVFASGYNRGLTIRGCLIAEAGANGVALVGSPDAVRNPLFEAGQHQALKDIDRTPGPKSPNYPAGCLVEDCLIYRSGRVEKQTAPVQIAMAQSITVRHCSLYDVPRAGINIGDGCWGGHVIEFCDIFDTVKETGDHGSFNSWGRDRFHGLGGVDLNTVTLGELKGLPLLDAVKSTILRNNRWRCDHGWDIDLDDGSTNYEIRDNLCLNGGIKNREGFYRVCENNVMVNNSFHPHVWYHNSQDVFRRNIVFGPYKPIRVDKPWGKQCDYNLLHKPGLAEPAPAEALAKASGLDEHSLAADAMFVDPAAGDYRVKDGSPALKLGFKNFPMDQFGVRKPALKALARTPVLPGAAKNAGAPTQEKPGRDETVFNWLGGKIKNVVGMGEVSAGGLPGESGVLVVEVPAESELAKLGLKAQDAILGCNSKAVDTIDDLRKTCQAAGADGKVRLEVFRNQNRLTIVVPAARMVKAR
jgi:hypothetical protein